MTAYLSDTFTDSNNTALAQHTADVGGALWTVTSGPFYIFSASPGYAGANGSGQQIAFHKAAPPASGGIKVLCDLLQTSTSTSNWAGVAFQANSALTSYYFIEVKAQTTAIYKHTAAAGDVLCATSKTSTANGWNAVNTWATWEIDITTDGIISVFKAGALVLTYTDPSPLANGYTGLISQNTTTHWDNLSAQPLGVVPTSTQGSAAGKATVAGIGGHIVLTKGTAAGSATVAGVQGRTYSGTGTAAGRSTIAGIGVTFHVGQATTAGQATVRGISVPMVVSETTGTAAGAATVKGQGGNFAPTVGTAVGGAFVNGVSGNVIRPTDGTAAGKATVSGQGVALVAKVTTGTATGAATIVGVGGQVGVTKGTATGKASVAGIGRGTHNTVGSAAGKATVVGVLPPTAAVGTASGKATVAGRGLAVHVGIGTITGRATVRGAGTSIYYSVGTSGGASTVVGRAVIYVPTTATASGVSAVHGVGVTVSTTIGSAAGASSVAGIGFGHIFQPVPGDRTIVLLATSPRLILAAPVLRLVSIEAQSRTVVLDPVETRLVILPAAEPRTIIMPPDDRAVEPFNLSRELVL